jgi:hypothetical protein
MSRRGEGGAPCIFRARIVNRSDPVDPGTSSAEGVAERLPWHRPKLRKMDALDAKVTKSRTRNDSLHLS